MHLSLCDVEYLVDTVMYHPLMMDKASRVYVQEAMKHLTVGAATATPDIQPRLCETLATVGGNGDNGWTRDVMYLAEGGASWEHLTQLPNDLEGCSAVVTPSGVMVTGGTTGDVASRECIMWDVTGNEWKPVSAMSHVRCGHGSVVHKGAVYVVGGRDDGNDVVLSVEVYDMTHNQWSVVPHRLHKTGHCFDTREYSCGVHLCVLVYDDTVMQVYDPVCGTGWQMIDLPPRVQFGLCGAGISDNLYILSTKGTFHTYSFTTQDWTQLASPQHHHIEGSATVRQVSVHLHLESWFNLTV